MTNALKAGRRLLVTTALLASAVECGGAGASEASCAYLVKYGNREYLGADKADFKVGGKLGTATIPACDDTPNDGDDGVPEQKTGAYTVEGTDPAEAIAVGDTPREAVLATVRVR
ncbi:DUF6281 family protein [Streptomyces sp. NPDC001617]